MKWQTNLPYTLPREDYFNTPTSCKSISENICLFCYCHAQLFSMPSFSVYDSWFSPCKQFSGDYIPQPVYS